MPLVYSLPATGRRSDALVAQALAGVPPDARSSTRAREELLAIVWGLLLVDAALSTWVRMLFISTAVGVWLDAHGRDRDMLRRAGESDGSYAARIPLIEDAVTPGAVLAAAKAALAGGGVAGVPTLLEIPRDGLHLDVGYLDSERVLGPGPAILMILPAATPTAVASSTYEAVRAKKAAGVALIVQPSSHGGTP